jgi:hypothetical protein
MSIYINTLIQYIYVTMTYKASFAGRAARATIVQGVGYTKSTCSYGEITSGLFSHIPLN